MKHFWRHSRVGSLTLGLILWPALVGAEFWSLDDRGERVAVEAALADDVVDPVFALLAGLLDRDVYGSLSPDFVDSVVTAQGGSNLPHRSMKTMTRVPGEGGVNAVLELVVEDGFKVSVPYSILGYNPGSLQADSRLVLHEFALGDTPFWITAKDEPGREVVAKRAYLYGLAQGEVRLDVDWWLDRLLGGKLDDVDLVGFMLFHLDERRYALAFGYNKKGRGRSGVFDLTNDEIVFPAPKQFLQMGRTMRQKVERLLGDS